jgi:sterol 24-C-methyltransferase
MKSGICAFLVLLTAGVAGMSGFFQQGPAVLWYRASTSLRALYALLTLPEDQVTSFVQSYEIFDKEAVTGTDDDWKNIVNYYQVVNHLCAVGEVEKMYIPPVMDLKLGIFGNQLVWEEKGMADKLEVGPGKKVLDVGCGRGRIAHHVASYTGAKVVGLNIDKGQIRMAKEYAEATGLLGSQLDFVESNYNMPFPFDNETFDALYHVQALTYAQDLVKLLREMHRVLKPGAKISFLDWFKLDAYKPEDSHHRKLLREVKMVIGAVYTPSADEYHAALKEAGFEVVWSGEASIDGGHQWPLVMQADDFYTTVKSIVDWLTKFGLIPGHLKVLLERLTEGGESFVEADKLGLFTTSWQIIAQKPQK